MCALLLGFLAQLACGTARALTLRVSPGATCLDLETLRRELLPHLSVDAAALNVQVEVEGSSDDPRTVVMRVRHPDGAEFQRTFSPAPERCPHLHQALALALALALKAVPSAPSADTPRTLSPSETARTQRLVAIGLGAGPAAGVDVAGAAALGGELDAELAFRHAALRLGALALRAARVDLGPGHYESVSLAGRADACGRLRFGRSLAGELCGGALAGSLFVRGGGLPDNERARLRQLSLSVSAGLCWEWGRGFVVRAGAGASFGVERLALVVRDAEGAPIDQLRLPPVAGLFGLVLGYNFRLAPR